MFCGAVGAGNSLLLLLGNSVESKGMISVSQLLFAAIRSTLVSVSVSFQDKAKMFAAFLWEGSAAATPML